jgi:cell wall-associated NlpC family hydrolase
MIDIERYRNIPYKDHGRTFAGVDCWGLLYLVYKNEFGLQLPSWSAEYVDADDAPAAAMLEKDHCVRQWQRVSKPFIGAGGLFEVAGNLHVGVCIDVRGRQMLHVTKDTQVTVENIHSIIWRRRFRGWWRYEN